MRDRRSAGRPRPRRLGCISPGSVAATGEGPGSAGGFQTQPCLVPKAGGISGRCDARPLCLARGDRELVKLDLARPCARSLDTAQLDPPVGVSSFPAARRQPRRRRFRATVPARCRRSSRSTRSSHARRRCSATGYVVDHLVDRDSWRGADLVPHPCSVGHPGEEPSLRQSAAGRPNTVRVR